MSNIHVVRGMGTGEKFPAKSVIIYGKSKLGKTIGCIPRKARTLYIQVEPNDPKDDLDSLGIDTSHIDAMQWAQIKRDADGKILYDENGNPEMEATIKYTDFREFFANPKQNIIPYGYKYIVIDSFSELMRLCFNEIKTATGGTGNGKVLGEYQQAAQRDYGIINDMMLTFMESTKALKRLGINIIMVCQEGTDDKGCAVPLLIGKKFGLQFPYQVDLMGYVTEGVKVKPDFSIVLPIVKFEPVQGLFEAGWRGNVLWKDKPQKLDIEQIVERSLEDLETTKKYFQQLEAKKASK